MLWYKAWLETRWRFLVCLVGVLLPCALFYRIESLMQGSPIERPAAYFHNLFSAHLTAVAIWPYAAIFLGMGGLLRERAAGSSALTLTLPVSRAYVTAVRVGVGIAQVIALAAAPWIVNLLISGMMRTPFSYSLAASCILLLVSGGAVFFATAILISSIVEGEYTSITLVFAFAILAGFLAKNVSWLRMLDLQRLMSGQSYIDKDASLFLGPLPWFAILASLSAAALLVMVSIGIMQRREF